MVNQVADELVSVVTCSVGELNQLDSEAVSTRPTPDRWTIKQVLGHLIDSATNNHQRFVRAQLVTTEQGEFVFPKYQQNEWVGAQEYDSRDWQELVEFWSTYNLHLAHIIRQVRPDALQTTCRIGDYDPMTLEFLITDYVDHLKHHLRKIAERVGAEWSFATE